MNLVCMTSRFSTVKIGSEDCESPGCKLFSISTPENLAHMQNKLCLIWNYQVIFLIQPQLNMRNISAESCKNISAVVWGLRNSILINTSHTSLRITLILHLPVNSLLMPENRYKFHSEALPLE